MSLLGQPSSSLLMNTPLPILQNIASFCDFQDVIALELTTRNAFTIGQYFWKIFVANQNPFLYATVTKTIESEKCNCRTIKLYSLYNTEPCSQFSLKAQYTVNIHTSPQTERLISNLSYFLDECEDEELQQIALKTNLIFLTQFSPRPEQLPSLQDPENDLNKYLRSRNIQNTWRKIFAQLITQPPLLVKQQKLDSTLYLGVETAFLPYMQVIAESLILQYNAYCQQQTELFALLQNYKSHHAISTPEYDEFNHLLLLKEVNQGDPVRLKNLITSLKINQVSINMRSSFTALSKLSTFFAGDHSFDNVTALESALKGTLKEATKLAVIKVLIDAKANVCDPQLFDYASQYSASSVVNTLISAKADVSQINLSKICYAQEFNDYPVVEDASEEEFKIECENEINPALKEEEELKSPNKKRKTDIGSPIKFKKAKH